jgi:uncharacterized protein (DUF952 family)
MIYKISDTEIWRAAEKAGAFQGSPDDLRDGFIHFSTAGQLVGTLEKYYAGREDLILAAIEPARLGDALIWEPARGGILFPHLYADLAMSAVAWTKPLPLGANGRHRLPEGVI